ncbi:L-type lectin-domain containing receptor kinase I.8-like [Durio zibethinus]|uniref:non-specific serine/threonine protein kinase n=1 Tax=Durio zibethinus TaxID=66656 RepID=A0A6P5XV63_DURZI|nr:L-type lectin-domain containing receptor kinase I.8-like [Durio zibethinus]
MLCRPFILFTMAAAFTSFCFWLFSCLSVISLARAEDPDQFIYNGFRDANLHLDGNAKIHPTGRLQLTNITKQLVGHAFHPSPINFNASSPSSVRSLSFSTNFVIAMVPELKSASGHGLAFVISQSTDFSRAEAVQYLGLFSATNNGNSANHIFAVEFDTIQSLDMKDIDNNHVGIDVNSVISNRSIPAAYFSNKERKNKSLNLISGDPIQVWIDYSDGEKLLNVTLAPTTSPKPYQPLLSTSIDLTGILLDTMYVGFSAATGTIANNKHYILGWSFNRSGQAQSLDISGLPKLPKVGGRTKTVLRLIMIIAAALLLLIITGATYVYRKKKYEEINEDWEKEYGPQRFSYKTLYKATKGFKDKQLLGSGGFGKVYKGTLPFSDEEIAVKKVSHESDQGMKEFVSEIVSMGRLRHRNLVRLRGYCRRKKELLLVYDYMANGSLDKFLFNDDNPNLNWSQRFQIIRGVADALLYLHEGWEQVVLHRDIKASNVLLDSNLNGRLGDFGLARLYDRDGDPQTTRLVGTLGYLDPELARTGKATETADVFAFGAFLLEVACGRKPFDPNLHPEDIFLVDLVGRCWKRGIILDASDPRLQGNYVVEEMEKVLKLGLLCSNSRPDLRPTIKEVEQYLVGNASLPDIHLDSAQNRPSSILETLSLDHSTETNTSMANNSESNCIISCSSSVERGVSLNSLSSTETVLRIGR